MDGEQMAYIGAAVVLAVAGGWVVFGAGGGPADPGATPSPSPVAGTSPTPSVSPTPGDSGVPGATPTPGAASDAGPRTYRFSGVDVNVTHYAGLLALGNFTAVRNFSVYRPDYTQHVNASYAVELRANQEFSRKDITYVYGGNVTQYPVTSTYTEGDTTYAKRVEETENGTRTAYDKGTAPYSASEPQPVNTTHAADIGTIATSVIGASNWTYVGNETRAGLPLYRFDTNGSDLHAAVPGTVVSGEASFVIGNDGVVRFMSYDFVVREDDGDRVRYVYRGVWARVGATDVLEPSWTAKA